MRILRALAAVAVAVAVAVVAGDASPARAAGGRLKGTGSSYVGLAMQQWVVDGGSLGLRIDYNPTGSPAGLTDFAGGLNDFAATEAEFTSLALQGGNASRREEQRGYQYVPDVAGAVAIMYNVDDGADDHDDDRVDHDVDGADDHDGVDHVDHQGVDLHHTAIHVQHQAGRPLRGPAPADPLPAARPLRRPPAPPLIDDPDPGPGSGAARLIPGARVGRPAPARSRSRGRRDGTATGVSERPAAVG